MNVLANRVLLLLVFNLLCLGLFAQKQKNYFIVEPPKTDSLAIFKVGVQYPFNYQAGIAYNFTPRFSLGIGMGVLVKPWFLDAHRFTAHRTNQQNAILSSVEWGGKSTLLTAQWNFKKFYWRWEVEHIVFNPQALRLQDFESHEIYYETAFANDTLDADTYLPMYASQNYISTYLGLVLFNISKRFYVTGEIGMKKVWRSKFVFTQSNDQYDALNAVQKNYIDAIETSLKDNFNRSILLPVVNVFMVYKLKTCDC